MKTLFKGAKVYRDGGFKECDILVSDGKIEKIGGCILCDEAAAYDCSSKYIVPGLVDVHVHLREPGFSYKETVKTGTLAAARGGFTAICSMPNVLPPPDCKKGLAKQLEIIKKDACIKVLPHACITKGQKGKGELSDFEELSPLCAGFSDDGVGVQDEDTMRKAMERAAALGKTIVAHCEDERYLSGGYIHDGQYARKYGHKGISSKSEYIQIERDLRLSEQTGCRYHICHISTKESVELVRQAKRRGILVTCEATPHHIILCDEDIKEDGNYKMNPPLRDKSDRQAIIDGIKDGTIDMVATDHAPHSAEEKSRGLEGSAMGIVGLETAFPLMYTHLVKSGIITLEKLIELMSAKPGEMFGIRQEIKENSSANFAVLDLDARYKIDKDKFLSMGKNTPFDGFEVYGEVILTCADGRIVW